MFSKHKERERLRELERALYKTQFNETCASARMALTAEEERLILKWREENAGLAQNP